MVYQIVCFWYVIFIISSCTSFYFTHNVFSFIFFPFIQYFIYADIPFRYIHLGGQFLSDLSPTRKRVTVCARVTRVWEDRSAPDATTIFRCVRTLLPSSNCFTTSCWICKWPLLPCVLRWTRSKVKYEQAVSMQWSEMPSQLTCRSRRLHAKIMRLYGCIVVFQ